MDQVLYIDNWKEHRLNNMNILVPLYSVFSIPNESEYALYETFYQIENDTNRNFVFPYSLIIINQANPYNETLYCRLI